MVKVVKQKYVRYKLNVGQIKVLELVYKYRFVSRQLLASSLNIKPENGLYEKLEILVRHGYLGKRLEKRKTLDNIPASYYLTPQALKYLQTLPDHENISNQVFQESYRDKSIVGNQFIANYLNVYRQTLALGEQYPRLKVFTPRDLIQYSYFPKRLPDAFLSLSGDDPNQPHRFFFDIVRDRQPRGDLINKMTTYNDFFDDGGWDETESELPVILLICAWSPTERSIQRTMRSLLSRLDSDLRIYTSTITALSDNMTDKAIWTDVQDSEELVALDDIPVNP
jgi:hypothetical protein